MSATEIVFQIKNQMAEVTSKIRTVDTQLSSFDSRMAAAHAEVWRTQTNHNEGLTKWQGTKSEFQQERARLVGEKNTLMDKLARLKLQMQEAARIEDEARTYAKALKCTTCGNLLIRRESGEISCKLNHSFTLIRNED